MCVVKSSDVRVWDARRCVELVRITVPLSRCLCLLFAPDGRSIVSGWSDGSIRAFSPQTGTRLLVINDAHAGGVTALCCANDSRTLVSGGEAGHVRVWALEGRGVSRLLASMKEHQSRVNSLVINGASTECISGSNDGSAIVWSLTRFARLSCLLAPTQFRSLAYHPHEYQLVSAGSDRKLYYWDIQDHAPIRILQASTLPINAVLIDHTGTLLITAGDDRALRLYDYDSAKPLAASTRHAAPITSAALSPDGTTIITLGEDGAILCWDIAQPHNTNNTHANNFNITNNQPINTHTECKEQIIPNPSPPPALQQDSRTNKTRLPARTSSNSSSHKQPLHHAGRPGSTKLIQ